MPCVCACLLRGGCAVIIVYVPCVLCAACAPSAGCSYHGEWVQGGRTGVGTVVYANGDKYTGTFVEGRLDGRVRVVFATGRVVDALFRNGSRVAWATHEDSAVEKTVQLLARFMKKKPPASVLAVRAKK